MAARQDVLVWRIKKGFIDMEIDPATTPEYPHGKPKAWIKTKNTNERIYNSTGNPEQKSNGITNGYFEPTKSLINQYAEQEPRPSTPRGLQLPLGNNNNSRKNGCIGKACKVVKGWFGYKGGRRTRRAKSRRTKSCRVRRTRRS